MSTKPRNICTVRLAFEGDALAYGEVKISVDLVKGRNGMIYRVATPALPGQDEMGLTQWATTIEDAREAYRLVRSHFPKHIEIERRAA